MNAVIMKIFWMSLNATEAAEINYGTGVQIIIISTWGSVR